MYGSLYSTTRDQPFLGTHSRRVSVSEYFVKTEDSIKAGEQCDEQKSDIVTGEGYLRSAKSGVCMVDKREALRGHPLAAVK